MEKRRWTKEEISEYRRTHIAYFYANKDDANIFVPREYGFGYSPNFANPISWIVIAAIIAIIYITLTL